MSYIIRRTYVQDRIKKISEELKVPESEAFLRFCYSSLFDQDIDDIDDEDIIEGEQEKQIDIIHIDETEDFCDISIIQTTVDEGFKSNKLIALKNGLRWIFQTKKEEYSKIKNQKLVAKINEIREIQSRKGMANMNLNVYFISLGDEGKLPQEYTQELSSLQVYEKAGYNSFEFHTWGAYSLVDFVNRVEASEKVINQDIKIMYDCNKGSIINTSIGNYRGVICSVKAEEIARLVKEDIHGVIFNKNIRKYLGETGKINRSIYDSCTSNEDGKLFWFLNNGITMVCDSIDPVTDPDNAHLKVKNLQIVNGCQTSVTIFMADKNKKLNREATVLVRIYATSKDVPEFTDKITLTTNNQNKIGLRDLKSNDPIQIDLQKVFLEKYNYYYERKVNEFVGRKIDISKKISNERVAQAYLSFGRKKPSIAKSKPNYIWGSDAYYNSVFGKSTPAQLLFCYKLYDFCNDVKREKMKQYVVDENLYSTVTYGLFHILRIMGFLYFKSENFPEDKILDEKIRELEKDNSSLNSLYDTAVKVLNSILKENNTTFTSPNNFYKTNEIQVLINKKLNEIKFS